MLRRRNRGLDFLLKCAPIRHNLRKSDPGIYSKYVDSGAPVPEFEPKALTPKDTVVRAIQDAQTLITSSGPVSAVDRVHTALHGYLIHACEDRKLTTSKEPGILELYKLLKENDSRLKDLGNRSDDVNKILRSLGAVLDSLNPLRNKGSMAHPNESLVGKDEAMLAINAARTILHYLDAKFSTT